MSDGKRRGQRALELAQAFDQSFAEPYREAPRDLVDLVVLDLGGGATCAVRVAEIGALHAAPPVVEVPSRMPELAGVAGLRSAVVAVYDLAALLGLARAQRARWLAVVRGKPLALAFTALEGHARVPAATLTTASRDVLRFVDRFLLHGGARVPVVHLPALVSHVETRARAVSQQGEH